MIKTIQESPLHAIANPESIAIFGASNNFASMGSKIFESLIDLGFKGDLFPIHPKEEKVQGHKAYKDVADLPVVPDLAIFVLPNRLVCDTMIACGEKGIKHAVVVTAGFKEMGGEGVDLEDRLKKIAEKYGIRFVGPNCLGVVNPSHKVNTTVINMTGGPGFVGFVSQSGSLVTQMFDYLAEHGIGFSTAFSIGNAANIDIVDCLEYLGACPNTKVIAMYVESIDRGREFVEIASAISIRKPIVAYYAAGSETGKKATFSHTGSLAGPDQLYEGVFRQSGVVRTYSISEMFDCSRALGAMPLPAGNKVAIQTHSGGPGAAAADNCGREGLELPEFPTETQTALSGLIPHTASINNPVDITYSKSQQDFFVNIPKILLESDVVDILLIYYLVLDTMLIESLMRLGVSKENAESEIAKQLHDYTASTADLVKQYNKPVVGFTFRNLKEKFPQALMAQGIPVFPSSKSAVRAVKSLVTYTALKQKLKARADRD